MIRKLSVLSILALLLLSATGCQKLKARDNLNKGIKAFRAGNFEVAIGHFDTAAKLDPDLTNAELYLATAYAQQYIPGGPSDENQKFADNAIATFERVLAKDPSNESAISGLANLYQNMEQYQKAREYYKKQAELQPDNPVANYAVGSTDWILASNTTKPLPDEEKIPLIEEGLQYVDKALSQRPDYYEALAYKNLLLRQKSLVTKDPQESKRLEAEATEWFNKALAAARASADKGQGDGSQ